jgi:hypothetical protein
VILAEARCALHRHRVFGVVRRASGGFESWEARIDSRPSGSWPWPWRDTTFVHLRETTDVKVWGWCRDCHTTRTVAVADLTRSRRHYPASSRCASVTH